MYIQIGISPSENYLSLAVMNLLNKVWGKTTYPLLRNILSGGGNAWFSFFEKANSFKSLARQREKRP